MKIYNELKQELIDLRDRFEHLDVNAMIASARKDQDTECLMGMKSLDIINEIEHHKDELYSLISFLDTILKQDIVRGYNPERKRNRSGRHYSKLHEKYTKYPDIVVQENWDSCMDHQKANNEYMIEQAKKYKSIGKVFGLECDIDWTITDKTPDYILPKDNGEHK